ncbi:hypothetical protein [Lentzea sp. NPDC051838]|uniref:hypothetical protein n=1 Tax=Lentzea sp. NPDC051838 TaxID=3154849 RepID=UPI0034372C11
MAALQSAAGNCAVQRLIADERSVQRYREKTAMNFGAMDGALVESPFRNAKKQPWIDLITVDFDSVVTDSGGVEMPKGTATATYFANPAALSSFSFEVTGGPVGLRSDPGHFKVIRIEGVGYNDPAAAADIAATLGAGALEGPKRGAHRRYTKPTPGQSRSTLLASMSLAVFYNAGEAFHNSPATTPRPTSRRTAACTSSTPS